MKSTGVWLTRSGEETAELGAELLGGKTGSRSPCRVITLSGDLGAGKSTFARGALRALGASGTLKSPSYTLMELYDLPPMHVVHLDLYRLRDPAELENLGLADFHRPGYLWLIEWPERGAGHLPPADLGFVFSFASDGHRIERIEFVATRK
ncbi:MAG TPA: tRNA (adenosine(37)-N6)-threonylcarbamoyltransferase complex ATPase subunit type 1 TsaE [Steroidobacteraceae bacterium]